MQLVLSALLSGLIAGTFAILATRAIEKLGGLKGGIVATLPYVITPTSIGLAYNMNFTFGKMPDEIESTQEVERLTAAMFTIPIGMCINSVFLYQWYFWPRRLPRTWSRMRRLWVLVAISLLAWFMLSSITVMVQNAIRESGGDTIRKMQYLGLFCTFLQLIGGTIFCLHPVTPQKGTKKVPLLVLLARGMMAGTSMGSSIIISSASGVVAGLATTFPSIFMTIMVSVWLSQGSGVSTGAIGPMILGGLAPGVYSMTFGFATPRTGITMAVVIAWIVSVSIVSIPSAFFLNWRIKKVLRENSPQEASIAADNERPGTKRLVGTQGRCKPQATDECWGDEVDATPITVVDPHEEPSHPPATGTTTPVLPGSVSPASKSSPIVPQAQGIGAESSPPHATKFASIDNLPWGGEESSEAVYTIPVPFASRRSQPDGNLLEESIEVSTDPICIQKQETVIGIPPLSEEEYYGDCEDGHGIFKPKSQKVCESDPQLSL